MHPLRQTLMRADRLRANGQWIRPAAFAARRVSLIGTRSHPFRTAGRLTCHVVDSVAQAYFTAKEKGVLHEQVGSLGLGLL